MLGESADGNVREMRTLSGQVPMFPLWTYGYWQSKERYKSSRELLDVVKRYRQEQVPIDGIIQDWQYWGSNYTWNAMEFINEEFKDGVKMIDEVHRQHKGMLTERQFTVVLPDGTSKTVGYSGNEAAVTF